MSQTYPAEPVDTTATGKPHYEVLDGLRGTAAVMVVLFHITGMTPNWADTGRWVHHGQLAVDFFFMLSGFVIAYAYDDRWGRMGLKQFLLIRLVRLHPLVLLSAILGILSFVFDPFAGTMQSSFPLGKLAVAFLLAVLLLPQPLLPNRGSNTHGLNAPAWSLLQEYVGNIAYALLLRRLPTHWLFIVVALSGAGLFVCAAHFNTVDIGSTYETFWPGMLRMPYAFSLGLWLYRMHGKLPKLKAGWLVLSLVLIAPLSMPFISPHVPHGNGFLESLIITFIFPLVIWLGAHSDMGRIELALCRFAGQVSYPLYILHAPFVLIYMNYLNSRHPPVLDQKLWAVVVFVVVVSFAWAALKVYDEPIRRILRPLTR